LSTAASSEEIGGASAVAPLIVGSVASDWSSLLVSAA